MIGLYLIWLLPGSVSAAVPERLGTISTVHGVLELCHAGSAMWNLADSGTVLLNGDRLRTAKEGCALLLLPGGLKLYLDGESQAVVGFTSGKGGRLALNTLSLLYGRSFVKTAEDSLFRHNLVTLYASFYADGGGSFGTSVDPVTGETEGWSVSGVVTVHATRMKQTVLLTPNRLLHAEKGSPFSPLRTVDSLDLERWKWVDVLEPGLMDRERNRAMARREQIRAVLGAGVEDRIVVTRFRNKSDYKGIWDLETTTASAMAWVLKPKTVSPVECISSFEGDAVLDSLKQKASLVLAAEITRFDFTKDTRLPQGKGLPQTSLSCRIEFAFTLIQPMDKRVLLRFKAVETLKEKEEPGRTYKEIADRPFSLEDKRFHESIVGQTILNALNSAVVQMRDYLRM